MRDLRVLGQTGLYCTWILFTHTAGKKDFRQRLGWACSVLVFSEREIKLWGEEQEHRRIWLAEFGWVWGVSVDKLEWFTISWTGVSVLGMLRCEPFQLMYSGSGNRGVTGPSQAGKGGG